MNLGELLKQGAKSLSSGPTAALEAEVLLRHITGLTRAGLYSSLDQPVPDSSAAEYFVLLERLRAGEPLQYLTGRMEFYGLDFEVNSSALIPRPETEIMVERALGIAAAYPNPLIADIGCGSGAVAVALAKNLPHAAVSAVDVSTEALVLAEHNAASLGCANIEFIKSDLMLGIRNKHFDIICANLPYVPSKEAHGNLFEPQTALDGGQDGLDIIRALVRQLAKQERRPDWMLLEFGTGQAVEIQNIINRHLPGSYTDIIKDLIPLERLAVTRV